MFCDPHHLFRGLKVGIEQRALTIYGHRKPKYSGATGLLLFKDEVFLRPFPSGSRYSLASESTSIALTVA